MSPSARLLSGGLMLLFAYTFVAAAAHVPPTVSGPFYVALLVFLTGVTLVRLRFDSGASMIVLAGLSLYLAYLGYTGFGERNYDGGAQLQYIEYIVRHHRRPPAAECLICHHPPLYYAVGALVYLFFKATRLAEPTVGLQLFGLVLFLVFLGYGVRTMERLTKTKRELRLATALMVFWPYSYHNSVRLHNDSLACTLMAVALYYIVVWWQDKTVRALYLGAFFTGLGLLTKSSAYVLVAMMVVLLGLRLFRGPNKLLALGRSALVVAMLAGALALNARGKDSPTSSTAPLCHKILGNACDINKGQFVANGLSNYLYLDVRAFLHEPYALAEREGSGRQYFWNHLIKSSLFGTHNTVPDRETAYEFNRAIAGGINALTLAMCAYMLVGAFVVRTRALRRWGVALLCLACCLALMVGFRALIPAPHHTDFRHVFPMLILVSAIYASTVGYFRARGRVLARVGELLAASFLALTIVYFLPKHDLVIRMTTHVVERDLSRYSKFVPEGTAWDKESNLLIEENHIVLFQVTGRPSANELDISVDNNDVYEIEVIGDTTQKVNVGPAKKKVTGLARYTEKLTPPVRAVREIRVRPLSGDMAYTLGHLILR